MTPDSSAFVSVGNGLGAATTDGVCHDQDLSSYFNDMAQSFEQGHGFNDYDWDNIFSDLNATFV
jgi:hypothetical protein